MPIVNPNNLSDNISKPKKDSLSQCNSGTLYDVLGIGNANVSRGGNNSGNPSNITNTKGGTSTTNANNVGDNTTGGGGGSSGDAGGAV